MVGDIPIGEYLKPHMLGGDGEVEGHCETGYPGADRIRTL